jgi:hypothetical protein
MPRPDLRGENAMMTKKLSAYGNSRELAIGNSAVKRPPIAGLAARMTLGGMLAAIAWAAPGYAQAQLKTYRTPYWTVHSDLDQPTVLQVGVRLDVQAEDCSARFALGNRGPGEAFLFADAADYERAGGRSNTGGQFLPDRRMLLVNSPEFIEKRTKDKDHYWMTMRHEATHLMLAAAIAPRVPSPCINEGLAEYYGDALWTGDGLVTGVLTPDRCLTVKALLSGSPTVKLSRRELRAGKMADWPGLLAMGDDYYQCSDVDLWTRNQQAWSLIHFLMQAQQGKHQQVVREVVKGMSQGPAAAEVLAAAFGGNLARLHEDYTAWWKSADADSSRDLRDEATVATLTSFLARGYQRGMSFSTAAEFFRAAREGKLSPQPQSGDRLWLPGSLLDAALSDADQLRQWSLAGGSAESPRLRLTRPDGRVIEGSFRLSPGNRPAIKVICVERAKM